MRLRVLAMGAALAALAVPTAGATLSPASAAHGDPPAPHAAQDSVPAAHRSAGLSRSTSRAVSVSPLSVTIDDLTPSTVPAQGDIRVSGQVTNDDTSTWTTIKVYSFVSDEPITTTVGLEEAAASDPESDVGSRIVDDHDRYDASIDSLAPGQSASYSFSVPRRVLADHIHTTLTPGVYWFGVHALGQGPDGRDLEADGRARTFLPLVPQRARGQLPTSVVVPLRRPISHAEDGSLADVEDWTQTLSSGGRLSSLVDLAAGDAAQVDVTWLVDPALVDAVRLLAAGNPPRSLAATLSPGQADGEPSPSPSGGASDGPTDQPTDEPTDEPTGASTASTGTSGPADSTSQTDRTELPLSAAQLARLPADVRATAVAAQDWLARFTAAVHPGDELAVLPYGDTDVSAAARHDARLYQVARTRSGADPVLPGLTGVDVVPAVGSPSGYLSADAVDLLAPDTTALVTDQMLPADPADPAAAASSSAVVATDGHALVVTSTAAAAGGPGPDDPTAVIAMRQRLLAEAAVRFLDGDPEPLVVEVPHDWNPGAALDAQGAAQPSPPTPPQAFLAGLDVPWLDLTTVADAAAVATPRDVAADQMRYPGWQSTDELDAANFQAAARLIASGAALQSLLTLNNRVGASVAEEALGSTSYSARTHPDASRLEAQRSRAWIDARLRRVTVSAGAVTLTSSSGRFAATVTNGLAQPVTVGLDAQSDGRLRVDGPRVVQVPPHSRHTVLLTARADQNGVHQVTLRVTDKQGVALGGSTQLAIRSTQLSGVIWLVLGLGAVLLFGAIAVRLFRRIRNARRPAARGRVASSDEPGPAADGPVPDGGARRSAGAVSR